MQPSGRNWNLLALFAILMILSACSPITAARQSFEQTRTAMFPTRTPFLPSQPDAAQPGVQPSITPVGAQSQVWFEDTLPESLPGKIQFLTDMQTAVSADAAGLHVGVVFSEQNASRWVYALVVPFNSLLEEVSGEDVRAVWRGEERPWLNGGKLSVSARTRSAFAALWGEPGGLVEVVDEASLLTHPWAGGAGVLITPFENLNPQWKVLRVDGISPLDEEFKVANYPLQVWFGVREASGSGLVQMPASNRDDSHMTSLLITGVTALVRTTGAKMESNGMTYPGERIGEWLRAADFTHISNEVSFTDACPPADPYQTSLIFCSRPEYIDLLQYVGADIIELSGNHLMDWRVDAMPDSLEMYAQRGMKYYASGYTLSEAMQPLLLEHNGNRIAMIGCNPAGPPSVWATETTPGAAPCDWDYMYGQVASLREQGYLPVVTLQYYESYSHYAGEQQMADFHALANAGAGIVSGSQAHYPQTFAVGDGYFIHYGLGNLFFDQMWMPDGFAPEYFSDALPVAGTRLEFLDRHIVYEGRHISTELLTAVLEDWSQPRSMSADERRAFLDQIFAAGEWGQ